MAVEGGSLQEQGRDERMVKTTVNRSFQIHLWEDRTRGELWVPLYDPKMLVLVGDDFLRTASGNAVDAGQRTFEFQSVSPGKHQLLFEKRMGWKFTAEDRRVFVIDVEHGNTNDEAR